MKTATLPSLRVEPELRQAAESVLQQGESLSGLMEKSLRDEVNRRRNQAEFIARGLAARDEAKRTGVYHDAILHRRANCWPCGWMRFWPNTRPTTRESRRPGFQQERETTSNALALSPRRTTLPYRGVRWMPSTEAGLLAASPFTCRKVDATPIRCCANWSSPFGGAGYVALFEITDAATTRGHGERPRRGHPRAARDRRRPEPHHPPPVPTAKTITTGRGPQPGDPPHPPATPHQLTDRQTGGAPASRRTRRGANPHHAAAHRPAQAAGPPARRAAPREGRRAPRAATARAGHAGRPPPPAPHPTERPATPRHPTGPPAAPPPRARAARTPPPPRDHRGRARAPPRRPREHKRTRAAPRRGPRQPEGPRPRHDHDNGNRAATPAHHRAPGTHPRPGAPAPAPPPPPPAPRRARTPAGCSHTRGARADKRGPPPHRGTPPQAAPDASRPRPQHGPPRERTHPTPPAPGQPHATPRRPGGPTRAPAGPGRAAPKPRPRRPRRARRRAGAARGSPRRGRGGGSRRWWREGGGRRDGVRWIRGGGGGFRLHDSRGFPVDPVD